MEENAREEDEDSSNKRAWARIVEFYSNSPSLHPADTNLNSFKALLVSCLLLHRVNGDGSYFTRKSTKRFFYA